MSNTKPPPHPEQPERACNTHPDAPHGFDRTASHSAGRYVCECEGWQPPAGWKLVPTEPTTEMVVAARAAAYSAQCDASFSDCKQIYRAILSAAPAAPQPARVPLTDEQIDATWDYWFAQLGFHQHPAGASTRRGFARAIERAHGIGNEPAQRVPLTLPPMPEPAHRERVYAGHGNEEVVEWYTAQQMRDREAVVAAACAKLCEAMAARWSDDRAVYVAHECARACAAAWGVTLADTEDTK